MRSVVKETKQAVGLIPKCPMLSVISLSKETLKRTCEARIKANQKRMNNLRSAAASMGKNSTDVVFGKHSVPFPSCYGCKHYEKDVKEGRIPDFLSHIKIIEL